MDNQAEVREFLTTRRAKISPQQAGVPLYGTRRRVPGLRREEVAQRAGLSTDYYTRLEKGNLRSASEGVLEAISRALHLDEAERAHLHDLARTARDGARPVRRRTAAQQVRPSLQHLLDAMTGAAGLIGNGRLDVLAGNALARSLHADVFEDPVRPQNLARYCFVDPRSHDFYDNWPAIADVTVSILRTEAGRDPHDRALSDLVGELATRSEEFRIRWARHDVRLHQQGTKLFHHSVVGDITLDYNTVPLPRRRRPVADRLHRGTRHRQRRQARPPRQLGGRAACAPAVGPATGPVTAGQNARFCRGRVTRGSGAGHRAARRPALRLR